MKSVDVDTGQILIIKKELAENFIDNECESQELMRKKIKENVNLGANYSDCCAVTNYGKGRTKVTRGVYCVNTVHGDGLYYFEVNPENTEVSEDFIGFTEDSTGFDYTVYKKWYFQEDEEEGYAEYLVFDESTGTIKIEEAGEYVISDPCFLDNDSPTVFLEEGKYEICFFKKQWD